MDKYKSWIDQPEGQYWCPIANVFFDKDEVNAAHIVPARVSPMLMDYVFGAGVGPLKDSAQNALFINACAEKAFDKGAFVVVPVDPAEQPQITQYKIVMSSKEYSLVNIGCDK
jgi:hypothetical protein